MAGEIVWDDRIQRYRGTPEFLTSLPTLDVTDWLTTMTDEQKAQMALAYMRSHQPLTSWLSAP